MFGWITWGAPQIPDRRSALMHAQRPWKSIPVTQVLAVSSAFVQLYERNWDEAKSQFDAAIRLNPNNADAVAQDGGPLNLLGQTARRVDNLRRGPSSKSPSTSLVFLDDGHGAICRRSIRRSDCKPEPGGNLWDRFKGDTDSCARPIWPRELRHGRKPVSSLRAFQIGRLVSWWRLRPLRA